MRTYIYELMIDRRNSCLDQLVKLLFWILSLIYGLIVFVTRGLYRIGVLSSYRAPKPVISIGNLTSGGVGKTPLVIWLVKALSDKGKRVVVLSRSYGSNDGFNDEIRMFKEILPQIPIMAGRDRKASIQKFLAQKDCDLFIADDAFQHWPLKRDLDVVAIDAVYPFGNEQLVPRGILREQVSELARAQVFVLTKTNLQPDVYSLRQRLAQINPRALIVESRHEPKLFRDVFTGKVNSLGAFQNQKVVTLCGIGDPQSFQLSLEKLNLQVVKSFVFSDHHPYTQEDLNSVLNFVVSEKINILVTTHKDAVKIAPLKNLNDSLHIYSLDIDLEITKGQDELIGRILSIPGR